MILNLKSCTSNISFPGFKLNGSQLQITTQFPFFTAQVTPCLLKIVIGLKTSSFNFLF